MELIQKTPPSLPFQTVGEEIANAILHGIGVLAATAGLVLLTLKANGVMGGPKEGPLTVTAYVLYTVTMILMFLASTLYHALQHRGAKRVFRILDHSAIYLLIAGTYTPYCLTALRGAWGWSIFGVEWGLAILGIVLYAVNYKPLKKIEVAAYILMGWTIVIGWLPLVRSAPRISVVLLILGGVFYTLGTFWYRKKNMRKAHVIWHVFVLAGALCHWLSVWWL
ncbi:MAG: hemolysin III family protein [Spirochaetaceae bacterium]|jgi:hemolysin III|nr:hemolysin III family protein [Spirochaetaceae bacterium]